MDGREVWRGGGVAGADLHPPLQESLKSKGPSLTEKNLGQKDLGSGRKDKGSGRKDKGSSRKDKGSGWKDKGSSRKDKGSGRKDKGRKVLSARREYKDPDCLDFCLRACNL